MYVYIYIYIDVYVYVYKDKPVKIESRATNEAHKTPDKPGCCSCLDSRSKPMK